MKEQIENLIRTIPKVYIKFIKNRPELLQWVMSNSLLSEDRTLPEHVYSAIHGTTDICEVGNKKTWCGISIGWKNCGRASTCACAHASVSASVKIQKASRTAEEIQTENDRRAKTNRARYGVENTAQSSSARAAHKDFYADKIKVSQAIAKFETTMMEKWGSRNPQHVESIKQKSIQTNRMRYGVDNPMQSSEVQELARSTNMKLRGVPYASQSDEVKMHAVETNLARYGVDHAMQLEDVKSKMKTTCDAKYGGIGLASEMIGKKIRTTTVDRYGGIGGSSEIILSKMKATSEQRYGTPFSSQKHYTDDARLLLNDETVFKHEMTHNTVANIANKYGISATTIYLKAKELNIPTFKPAFNTRSNFEIEVETFIRQHYSGTILTNTRTIIAPAEIDIWLPELNLALECNGSWWHSELAGRATNYHSKKTNACRKENIQLFHVWEHLWKTKQNLVKSMILNRLKCDNKIFARHCVIKPISVATARTFFNDNHLQGYTHAGVRCGLFHNETLVMAATFSRPRFNKHYEWELIRMAALQHHTIVGGASKLIKHFISTYSPSSILSYCDRSHGTGDVYKKLNFQFCGTTRPNYWYTNDYITFHGRSKFQKHKLKQLLPHFDPALSEWENMKNNGWNRIFDSGNDIYALKFENN